MEEEKKEKKGINLELSTVKQMLLVDGFSEARVLMDAYLEGHAADEMSAVLSLSISFFDRELSDWFLDDVFPSRDWYTYQVVDILDNARDICAVVAEFPVLREKFVHYLAYYIRRVALLSKEIQNKALFICTIRAFCPFLLELPCAPMGHMPSVAEFWYDACGVEYILHRYLSRLLPFDRRVYAEETLLLADKLLGERKFAQARTYYELALFHLDHERWHECQFKILCAKLGVVDALEFTQSDTFSLEMEEYICLLIYAQEYTDDLSVYIELATKTVIEQECRRAERALGESREEMRDDGEGMKEEKTRTKKTLVIFALAIGLLTLFTILIYLWK
ncbi:MAG: hypothetical protein IKC72_07255 [Clostridia bacterium]|nr:hypothetical protein [Clostridia bacterium]